MPLPWTGNRRNLGAIQSTFPDINIVNSLILGSFLASMLLYSASPAQAAETHRIPDAPAEYLAMKNPIDGSQFDKKVLKKVARLYKRKCRQCHGEKGDGKGSKAEFFQIKPAAFSTPGYLKNRKDGQLFWILKYGSPDTEMEAKGLGSRDNLTDQEMWSLIAYIRRTFTR